MDIEELIRWVDFKINVAKQTGYSEKEKRVFSEIKSILEKIKDKDNKIWAIIRCNACNGTTDCENSPECPENYDGCIADDILKEIQTYLQQPTEH
jgi:hypothetical protein